MTKTGNIAHSGGFTIIEIIVVSAVIGLLASLCIPAFFKARNNTLKGLITNNLRIIEGAFLQEALYQGLDESDIDNLAVSAIDGYFCDGYAELDWPAGAENIPEATTLRGEISVTFADYTFTCDDPCGSQ